MVDTESKLSKVLDLLIQQTKSGKVAWKEGYKNSFQTVLADQTIVLELEFSTPALEIRDSRGDLVQRVRGDFNPLEKSILSTSDSMGEVLLGGGDKSKVLSQSKVISSSALGGKVAELLRLVSSRYERERLDTTLDSLLKELGK